MLWLEIVERAVRELAELTVQQLIDQHKVILYALLVEFAKVASANAYQAIAEFEYEGRIDIALCHACYVEVQVADMKEGRAPERQDGRLD